MVMESFIANGQAYFYYRKDGKVFLKLGSYSGKTQKKDIAQIKRSKAYPFEKGENVILKVCGKELQVSSMSDLDIFLELEKFGGQLLW